VEEEKGFKFKRRTLFLVSSHRKLIFVIKFKNLRIFEFFFILIDKKKHKLRHNSEKKKLLFMKLNKNLRKIINKI